MYSNSHRQACLTTFPWAIFSFALAMVPILVLFWVAVPDPPEAISEGKKTTELPGSLEKAWESKYESKAVEGGVEE